MWQQWYEDEETYIKQDNPKEYAELVVEGTKSFDQYVLKDLFENL